MASSDHPPAYPNDQAAPSIYHWHKEAAPEVHFGLTKREYIAAQALHGILANPKWVEEIAKRARENGVSEVDVVGLMAVDLASGLIRALNGEKGTPYRTPSDQQRYVLNITPNPSRMTERNYKTYGAILQYMRAVMRPVSRWELIDVLRAQEHEDFLDYAIKNCWLKQVDE